MKTPKASEALMQAPDLMPTYAYFALTTQLHNIGKIGPTRVGPPLTKSWIHYCEACLLSWLEM